MVSKGHTHDVETGVENEKTAHRGARGTLSIGLGTCDDDSTANDEGQGDVALENGLAQVQSEQDRRLNSTSDE